MQIPLSLPSGFFTILDSPPWLLQKTAAGFGSCAVVAAAPAAVVEVATFVVVVVDWFDVWFDMGDVHPATSTVVISIIIAINPIRCFLIALPS